ncbi:FGGY-family carbohydrate kinase [Alicyclobacillus fastidiosus]|nr:FGGY-family carbohydrate kinase [Alicyclobacillus fastidiosus]
MVGVLDGIAIELHQYVKALPGTLQMNIKHLVGAGNAIRKNVYLASIVQDIFGRSLLVPRHREEAAVGAALCAGVGVGAYESFNEAAADVIDYALPS